MNAKISIFVICVKTIVHLSLYDLYDCTFKTCQQIYVECNLGVCRTLKTSLNESIRNLNKHEERKL